MLRKLRKSLDKSKKRLFNLPRLPKLTELSSKSKSPLVLPRKPRRESLSSKRRLILRELPTKESKSRPS